MIGTLRTVVLDAPDARRLAAFYAALGGWTEQYADDDWITMETGDGWRIAAQRSPDHVGDLERPWEGPHSTVEPCASWARAATLPGSHPPTVLGLQTRRGPRQRR